jgi:hypothetical protein
MAEKRRQYTEECQQDGVRLVPHHGDGGTAAARNLGRQGKRLGRWQRHAVPPTNGRLGGNGQMAADPEARLRLRQEHQRLRLARAL